MKTAFHLMDGLDIDWAAVQDDFERSQDGIRYPNFAYRAAYDPVDPFQGKREFYLQEWVDRMFDRDLVGIVMPGYVVTEPHTTTANHIDFERAGAYRGDTEHWGNDTFIRRTVINAVIGGNPSHSRVESCKRDGTVLESLSTGQPFLLNTAKWHRVVNDGDEPRAVLSIGFYQLPFYRAVRLYRDGRLFRS